ncbi:hypothetical protein MTQ13_25540 [Streptomyces sp. XM4011]|uniref:hypothetical protein n=1 Tax=Streptomyces sp. XM4011 TaxID=2929780 RepID=UPI001FF71BC1|nr:hypothetical protein [Streptomyces sp. XM4011]MCK1817599.1 hypothetical protein [Streptomyces sp. XM4011]
MADLLFEPLLMAAALCPVAVLLKVLHALGSRRMFLSGKGHLRRLETGAFALVLAVPLYAFGLMSSFHHQPGQVCYPAGLGPGPRVVVTETLVPLSRRCVRANGEAVELIPAWLNPTLAVLLTVSLVSACASAAQWAARARPGDHG